MNAEDKQFLANLIETAVKETTYSVNNSTKRENSGLVGELRDKIKSMESKNDKINDALITLIEKVSNIEKQTTEMKKASDDKHKEFTGKLDSVVEHMETNYVSKEDFSPIKMIVYGMVGFILLSVLGAIVGLVVVKL